MRDNVRSEDLANALARVRIALFGVGILTAAVNILTLTSSFFMLEIYDRVIPSRSIPTLVGLCVIGLFLFSMYGIFDLMRSRILVRAGLVLDSHLSKKVYTATLVGSIRSGAGPNAGQLLRDLDIVRGFMSGMGPTTMFDLPWMPLYIGICFLFHPFVGLVVVAGGVVLVTLTLVTELRSKNFETVLVQSNIRRMQLSEAGRRNAEALRALGMTERVVERWAQENEAYSDVQRRSADVTQGLGSISRIARQTVQSGALALGAYLVINNLATSGVIIASSILTARALAPLELAISHWKHFVSARQAWRRLGVALVDSGTTRRKVQLPAPRFELQAEKLSVRAPRSREAFVIDVNFRIPAGHAIGVVGASASGKSTLARALVGVWAPAAGRVRLDGAALDQWNPDDLGRHIGYLPQDVELFSGTVAENIARFEPGSDSAAIIEAATVAGVHEMILALSDGYETEIGEGGGALSAGQRQRIGLARALYRDPFLVVLDEPNSNLDAEGDAALTCAIESVRRRAGIAIIVAHRQSAVVACDYLLIMERGRLRAFGTKEEVQARLRASTNSEGVVRPIWPQPSQNQFGAASTTKVEVLPAAELRN